MVLHIKLETFKFQFTLKYTYIYFKSNITKVNTLVIQLKHSCKKN